MSRRDKIADDLFTVWIPKFCLCADDPCEFIFTALQFDISTARGLIRWWPLTELNVNCLLSRKMEQVDGVNFPFFVPSNWSNHESFAHGTKGEEVRLPLLPSADKRCSFSTLFKWVQLFFADTGLNLPALTWFSEIPPTNFTRHRSWLLFNAK